MEAAAELCQAMVQQIFGAGHRKVMSDCCDDRLTVNCMPSRWEMEAHCQVFRNVRAAAVPDSTTSSGLTPRQTRPAPTADPDETPLPWSDARSQSRCWRSSSR